MPRFDQTNAECSIFTFKEGLLSSVAHDLRIAVTRFELALDGGSLTARFDATSLRVDTPMKDGAPNPSALGAADKEKIAAQIRDDVLHSSRFPEAVFRSTSLTAQGDGGYEVAGELTLHGVTKEVRVRSHLVSGRQEVELRLHQPDFGITPYRAMLGTLKIQPDVVVRLRV
jgi:YceI-like domain